MPYEHLIENLTAGDRSGAARRLSRADLAATLDLAERYARIEKKVLGAAAVAYSPTSLEIDAHEQGSQDDTPAFGERIAATERARLGLPAGPVLELVRVIEEQGIKVLPRRFPSAYSGGFFFDAKLGPCILVQADASQSAQQYSLAHQYAHFVIDYDPYISTLCGWPDDAALTDSLELRAHATALALLMPREDLETYRDAFDVQSGAPLQPAFVQQLCVYFELDPEQVFWRLLMLGWIDAPGLQKLLGRDAELASSLRSTLPTSTDAALLPARFVRLVASAFGSGKLDIEAAARFLGTDVDGAESILGQFEYEQPDTDAAAQPSEGGAKDGKRGKNGNGSPRPLGN